MGTKADAVESQETKWYEIAYPASAYTFPHEALIRDIRLDDQYFHCELIDGRILSVPLSWIPSVLNAPPQERAKYEISGDRRRVIWDPDKCAINDDVCIDDYLMPPR